MKRAIVIPDLSDPTHIQVLRRLLLDLQVKSLLEESQSTVQTTDATLTTAHTLPLNDNSAALLIAMVVGRRTGGSAGTAGDSAAYLRRALFRRTAAGNATLVGSVQDGFTAEDQAPWDCTLAASSTKVVVQVTGAANNTVQWLSRIIYQDVTL